MDYNPEFPFYPRLPALFHRAPHLHTLRIADTVETLPFLMELLGCYPLPPTLTTLHIRHEYGSPMDTATLTSNPHYRHLPQAGNIQSIILDVVFPYGITRWTVGYYSQFNRESLATLVTLCMTLASLPVTQLTINSKAGPPLSAPPHGLICGMQLVAEDISGKKIAISQDASACPPSPEEHDRIGEFCVSRQDILQVRLTDESGLDRSSTSRP